MNKKLAGTILCFNGCKYDYNFKESIQCLLDFCEFVVVAAGGEDGTLDEVLEIQKRVGADVMHVIEISKEEWDSQHGKWKLNYFTNICIEYAQKAGYEYQFNLQSDEILKETCYPAIHKAIATGFEGFMCKRINLWGDCYRQLDVPQERKPCSTEIIRLAKTVYRSVDDAENIGVGYVDFSFLNDIRIYHMGFVRKFEIMRDKIINMQVEVFEGDYDKKLDITGKFQPEFWFTDADLKVIDEPLPLLIQDWARERYESNLKA